MNLIYAVLLILFIIWAVGELVNWLIPDWVQEWIGYTLMVLSVFVLALVFLDDWGLNPFKHI